MKGVKTVMTRYVVIGCSCVFFFLLYFFFFKQKTAYEMLRSLVGSEMCIRDRCQDHQYQLLETLDSDGICRLKNTGKPYPKSAPSSGCRPRHTISGTNKTTDSDPMNINPEPGIPTPRYAAWLKMYCLKLKRNATMDRTKCACI